MFIGPCIIVIVEELETNLMSLVIFITLNICSTHIYILPHYYVKCKVKCILVQALKLCTGRMAHRGVEVQLYSFLTTELEEGDWSESRPDQF